MSAIYFMGKETQFTLHLIDATWLIFFVIPIIFMLEKMSMFET